MSEHLPECWDHPNLTDKSGHACICDRLRACETRVRSSVDAENASAIAEMCNAEYSDGQRDMWQAARDAVAALPYCYGKTGMVKSGGMFKQDALAAIDGVRP